MFFWGAGGSVDQFDSIYIYYDGQIVFIVFSCEICFFYKKSNISQKSLLSVFERRNRGGGGRMRLFDVFEIDVYRWGHFVCKLCYSDHYEEFSHGKIEAKVEYNVLRIIVITYNHLQKYLNVYISIT